MVIIKIILVIDRNLMTKHSKSKISQLIKDELLRYILEKYHNIHSLNNMMNSSSNQVVYVFINLLDLNIFFCFKILYT